MKKSWRHFLFTNGLAASASCVVSAMIISASHYYSLGLFFLIIAPLTGGSLATFMVLCILKDGDELYLIRNFWQILLLGTSVALVVTTSFICALSQHFLLFPTVSMWFFGMRSECSGNACGKCVGEMQHVWPVFHLALGIWTCDPRPVIPVLLIFINFFNSTCIFV